MAGQTIIVGGGLAGLAAAVELATRGVPVTLLESRGRLGGRASSFVDRATGETIDNCQHVAMGCCTNFLHFCRTIGAAGLLREERALYFVGPPGAVPTRFAESRLPAPLHLWRAFRGLGYLSRADLRAIHAGLRRLARADPATLRGRPFGAWLEANDQTAAAIRRFWHVVLVSALSETLDRIDAAHARKVFVDGFLANRQGWRVHIPTSPLDELYGERMQSRLRELGATVRLHAGVERVLLDGEPSRTLGASGTGRVAAVELRSGELDEPSRTLGASGTVRVAGVELRSGEQIAGEQFILAVPHHLVPGLLPEPLRDDPDLQRISELESAPISSVHLWFDRPITSLPHAVFIERLSQWMFNRTEIRGQAAEVRSQRSEVRGQSAQGGGERASGAGSGTPPPSTPDPPPCYYQIVISASRELAGRPQDETIADVVRELAEVWPAAGEANLLRGRVVTEHRAVFSPTPGCEALRPAQQSPIANLQLAGDWTRTGWPATMEGAVRSGYLAAENVLAHLGRPERLVQPDLPVAWLARMLLGLPRRSGFPA